MIAKQPGQLLILPRILTTALKCKLRQKMTASWCSKELYGWLEN